MYFKLYSFVDHQGWSGTHIPGNPLGLLDVQNLPRIPWEALVNLIPEDMPTAPVLPLCWRTRLLHPLYPYLKCVCVCACVCVSVSVFVCLCLCLSVFLSITIVTTVCSSKEMSYLADHCSEQINLHFTEDGYLTGDMSMDFPPMRCVLLDPFTG